MNSYVDKLKALKFGWNEHPLWDRDFFAMVKKLKVKFSVMPLKRRGYYSRVKGKNHITISDRLNEFQATFVMFHELGHVLMHAPSHGQTTKFSGKCEGSREENEADAFAYCALLPLPLLSSVSGEELVNEYGYPTGFLMKRLEVYERYGI